MILHFIKRDFNTHRLTWAIIGLATLLGLSLAAVFGIAALGILLYAYFFLGIIPMYSLVGSNWRTQHVMSRNYMLSLPLKRSRLFLIIQVRALVFWLPFIVLAMVLLPFAQAEMERLSGKLSVIDFFVFLLCLLFNVIWFINMSIKMQISFERITSYLTQKQRALKSIGSMVIYIGGMFVIGFSFFGLFALGIWWDILVLTLVAMLSFFFFSSARDAWLYQQ